MGVRSPTFPFCGCWNYKDIKITLPNIIYNNRKRVDTARVGGFLASNIISFPKSEID